MLSLLFSQQRPNQALEVFFSNPQWLKKYDQVEVSVSYYPYDKEVNADTFDFEPYEDYVADLVSGRRSTYQHKNDGAPQIFGFMIGGAIVVFFTFFYPTRLISVESLVSIFAAYTVGKEIWHDLDAFLLNLSKNWPIRWGEKSYYYVLQQFGTIQRFWQRARFQRFGYQLTLPDEIDVISHSNSKTVEMSFNPVYFLSSEKALRVLQIIGHKKNLENGLVIIRLGVVKKLLGWRYVTEFYQAYDRGQVGTLDLNDVWFKNKVLEKKYLSLGRVVWFTQEPRLVEKKIIEKSSS